MNTNLETMVQDIKHSDSGEMESRYLTFWMDEQLFGVPISYVLQIVGMQNITAVPDYPSYAKGVIDLRGCLTPLIDVRIRLGKKEILYNERTCIIVLGFEGQSIGFIVDEVEAVMEIPADLLSQPPDLCGQMDGYIQSVGRLENRIVLLLDTEKIIGKEEFNILMTKNED